MHMLVTHFEELLKALRPSEDRLQAAKELPAPVREFLKNSPEFPTVMPHTVLVGSYAQEMSAGDVKDVDFLVVVPGDPERNEPEAKQLIQNLYGVLDALPEYLEQEGYADVDIERARRSVHVYFTDRDFHLDVVPCIAPNGVDEPVFVSDRGYNKWIPSHPMGVVNLIAQLDQQYSGKVRPLGILLKHFRNVHMKVRKPKSYWLTALLIHHVRTLDMNQPIGILFRDLVKAIHRQYASTLATPGAVPHIKDPMLQHDVSWNWERAQFETFMRRLQEVEKWSTNALDADTMDTAIELWQKVFGEFFPSDVEGEAKTLAADAQPGIAMITSRGLIGIAGATIPTRRTTFHGEDRQ